MEGLSSDNGIEETVNIIAHFWQTLSGWPLVILIISSTLEHPQRIQGNPFTGPIALLDGPGT